MKFFTKKRVVLFLLFIFPLICFLILSTGENNFKKLPVLTENIIDVSEIDASKSVQFKGNVTIVCFLGNDINSIKSGLFNLNEKIYKKFTDYKQFQIIGVYPKGKEEEVQKLKKDIGAFTDMQKWRFISSSKAEIEVFYSSFEFNEPLINLSTTKAFLIDKDVNLRGRLNDEGTGNKLYGYNMNSVSVLNGKLKDDVKVLYYEYYAAFKERNKNKADRKEVGL
ncbi:hypothetical protein BW723_09030 [Polaribacter reichenbachii]|uniref:Membrane or secreted protein n=1 Tax=Polaribacter reichenbachii TaxID=996801 RepID=A0A1B8U7E7_9FLAO|nr:hypothetical protein [Polaribacter reichenbachii]APZ46429.1 hypothetical protein BW723_09030 [Polaribacter reichenbachii]AUC20294.1 hypothetical protein BTO17_17065 [Polaribacter reichenbachii]OBY67805.1 hypothetical protein LPB301_00470 [Polaribacter reichenbachii]